MAKLILATLSSGFLDVDRVNENFQAIATWADSVVSRNGALPNQMEADLDLNGHTLLNSGSTGEPDSLVTRQDMEEFVQDRASGLLSQKVQSITATAGQTTVNLTSISYQPGANNLAVYVNGVRKFAGQHYLENSDVQYTFLTPLVGGEKIDSVATEFLGNVDLPSHTHTWGQITNTPIYTQRWPDWSEVTGKPLTFAPSTHQHSTTDITSGTGLADARRGIWVQSSQPTAGRVGEVWLW